MLSRGKAKRGGKAGAIVGLLLLGVLASSATSASAAAPTVISTGVSSASASSVVLEAELTTGGLVTGYHFEYDTAPYVGEAGHGVATPEKQLKAIESPKAVSVTINGLAPATVYHFRVVAKNSGGKVPSPDRIFATYAPSLGALPDTRAYEQASPVQKNGGDALGIVPLVKATLDGDGITFGSTSGIPGGEGAQDLPTYLASRGSDWSTQGLLPPPADGGKAGVLGWTPDFSRVYVKATAFGGSEGTAIFERPGSGGPPTQISPYLPATYAYAGASADGTTAIFESSSGQLSTSPAGSEGRSNVYAWDGSAFRLASVTNDETPLKAAFAGPYDWARERTGEGGATNHYYTQNERAVAEDGSVFFTSAGNGHLYQRLNPTRPQSTMSAGKCDKAQDACTVDVSPSRRTPADPAGEGPRAFVAASADGQTAFFTSHEELTDDAKTGPPVGAPKIGTAKIGGVAEEAEDVNEELLTEHHAAGIAVQGEHIYWADPSKGTIGRANLDGTGADDEFIVPGETCAETHPQTEPGQEQCAPSIPRYVAVDAGHLYWTNTGPLGSDLNNKQFELPTEGAGTIGRAGLDGSGDLVPGSVEPEFITGATNPQGIAVNAERVYWANSLQNEVVGEVSCIGRAAIGGGSVEQCFFNSSLPYGVALSGSRVYWTIETLEGFANIESIPLAGGAPTVLSVSEGTTGARARGIAVIGPHVYWAAQGREAIGRANLELEESSLEGKFLELEGALTGLASKGSQLYWSANGDLPPHPGNDLYRYQVGTDTLTDLTPDASPSDPNGAEVLGVLGASEQGTRVYFVANADLDGAGPAIGGDCKGRIGTFGMSGACSLYLWEEDGTAHGKIGFVARLAVSGEVEHTDAANWLPTTEGVLFQRATAKKASQLSADGSTLLFRSQRQLTEYESEGAPELYLYRVGKGVSCISCSPVGEAPIEVGVPPKVGIPGLGSIQPSALRAQAIPAAVQSRNLSDNGRRAFFETPQALSPEDTDGDGTGGCERVGGTLQQFPDCLDVYEWEATEEGSCAQSAPSYSPLAEGCLYLISSGKSDWSSLIGDASADGRNVFFFTRQGLVGQDGDELLDVYDARVGGGIASQNVVPPIPCESTEACHGPVPAQPGAETPSTYTFAGPPDPKPKRSGKKKHRKRHHRRKHAKGHGAHRRSHAERGAGR